MPILSIQTVQAGLVGVFPSLAYINTNDTLAEALATGYLNNEVAAGYSFQMPCMACVTTRDTPSSQPRVNWLYVSHVGKNWSLIPSDLVSSTTPLQVKSVVAAAAAGGSAAQSFTDDFCTTDSNVQGTWVTQTTPGQIVTIVPGNGSFVVTSTTNVGAGTFSYTITNEGL